MPHAIRHFAPATLAACLATAAPAQQAGGTITGTLGFEDAAWTITQREGLKNSRWREADGGYHVRLVGFPDRHGTDNMNGALVIAFTASGAPGAAQVRDPHATYHGADGDRTWSGSGTNVNVTLEAFNVSGDDLSVAASFTAAMVPGGTDDQIATGEDKLSVDGNFQATVGRGGGNGGEAGASAD